MSRAEKIQSQAKDSEDAEGFLTLLGDVVVAQVDFDEVSIRFRPLCAKESFEVGHLTEEALVEFHRSLAVFEGIAFEVDREVSSTSSCEQFLHVRGVPGI
jgi:hypothetical protein